MEDSILKVWKEKQKNELSHWITREIPDEFHGYSQWYGQVYEAFDKHLQQIDTKSMSVIDFGCSAYTFSCRYNFKKIYLVDTLIHEYAKIRNNFNNTCILVESLDEVPVKSVDISMVLNCLDHMPIEMAIESVKKIVSMTSQYILMFTDMRTQHDQHHYPFTYIPPELFTGKFAQVRHINCRRGDHATPINGEILILKSLSSTGDDGTALWNNIKTEEKDYWWD